MLQASELRIGNYVEYEGEYLPVCSIDGVNEFQEVGYKGSVSLPSYINDERKLIWTYNGRWLATCNPIPITNELLLKCGFENHDNEYMDKGDFVYYVDSREFMWKGSFMPQFIVYIHQLQNVYFALTNVELKVKI